MLARRQHRWRQAKGPDSEIFPPGVYLRETLKKWLKSKKFGGEEWAGNLLLMPLLLAAVDLLLVVAFIHSLETTRGVAAR